MQKYDQPGSLMSRAQQLLLTRDLLEVHRQTGIPYYWLRKFRAGNIPNPSVNRVQYLYERLAGKALPGLSNVSKHS